MLKRNYLIWGALIMSLILFSSIGPAQAGAGAKNGPAPHPAEQQMKLYRLPNALPVLIIPDKRFPLVSLRLYVHAGSAYETADQAGISHLLEHMVFKGTPSRPKGQISKEVEELGGYLNAATSFDYTVYIVDVIFKNLYLILGFFSPMKLEDTLYKLHSNINFRKKDIQTS